MNPYIQEYNAKKMTVDEALATIKSGDVIATSQAACDPMTILGNFHKLHGKVENIRMYAPLEMNMHPFMVDPQYADTFTLDATYFMSANRASRDAGITSFFPSHLHAGPSRWASVYHPNVFIGAATPMDEHGYMQVSLCLIHERTFWEQADHIILEVNPNMPHVYGDTEIHISQVDGIVEVNTPLPTIPKSQPNETDMAIGGYVSTLVNDGDTIQLGIGSIPDAAAAALMDKHDLGLHSEMIPNCVRDLVNAGVITNRKKNFLPGKMIGAFALGTTDLYDMLNYNPGALIMRGDFVTSPYVISKNDNFVSINTAMSVDLTGQNCSESIGSKQYSGSGGQADTVSGAAHSKGGRSIIAIPSTKKGGTISTINAQLPLGSVVTTSRNDIDYIVTEYGIAPMKGRAVRERINNLIAVAHPDFREQLRKGAERLLR